MNLMNIVKGVTAGGAICAVPAIVAVAGIGVMTMLSNETRLKDWDYGFNSVVEPQQIEWKEEEDNKSIIWWEDEIFSTEMLWQDEEEGVEGIWWWEDEPLTEYELTDINWNEEGEEIIWENLPDIEWEELI